MDQVLIWDDLAPPPEDYKSSLIVLWRGRCDINQVNRLSIIDFVEAAGERYKSTYLDWTNSLIDSKIFGVPVTPAQLTKAGLNLWCLHPIMEKSNFSNSKHINDAIKLIALFDVLAKHRNISRVVAFSSNKHLLSALKVNLLDRGLSYDANFIGANTRLSLKKIRNKIFNYIPKFIQPIIWVTYFLQKRRFLVGTGTNKWKSNNSEILIISYINDSSISGFKDHSLEGHYWGKLPALLAKKAISFNVLHIISGVQEPRKCKKLINILRERNRSSLGTECHSTLEAFLDIHIVKEFLSLCWEQQKNFKNVQIKNNLPNLSGINVNALFNDEICEGIFGSIGMSNLLTVLLFDRVFSQSPNFSAMFYLRECIAWEKAALHFFREHTSGYAIGYCHSFVREWDLRYFENRKSTINCNIEYIPQPDFIAVNDKHSKKFIMQDQGFADNLFKVEAVRYLEIFNSCKIKIAEKVQKSHRDSVNDKIRMLVITDYDTLSATQQISIAVEAALKCTKGADLIVKPHPAIPNQFYLNQINGLNLSEQPLQKLLVEADVVFVGSMTSAVVESKIMGCFTISMFSQEHFNLSPVGKSADCLFISNAAELTQILDNYVPKKKSRFGEDMFFGVEQDLPLWEKLIGHVINDRVYNS